MWRSIIGNREALHIVQGFLFRGSYLAGSAHTGLPGV